jgi:hypothetical protein
MLKLVIFAIVLLFAVSAEEAYFQTKFIKNNTEVASTVIRLRGVRNSFQLYAAVWSPDVQNTLKISYSNVTLGFVFEYDHIFLIPP